MKATAPSSPGAPRRCHDHPCHDNGMPFGARRRPSVGIPAYARRRAVAVPRHARARRLACRHRMRRPPGGCGTTAPDMAPLEWLALFLAALAAVGGSAWLMQRRRAAPADPAAAARKRARRARDLGWVYDETVTGDTRFTLRGTEAGVKWKIRYHAD